MWVFDPTTSTLTQIQQHGHIPRARFGAATAVVGSTMLLFGGTDGVDIFNDVWRLDLVTYAWTHLNCMYAPTPRHGSGMVAVNASTAILFGGRGHQGDLSGTFLLDLTSMVWSQICTEVQPFARSYFAFQKLHSSNRAVLVGGINLAMASYNQNFLLLGQVWVFDLDSLAWQALDNSRHSVKTQDWFLGRSMFGAVILCDKLIVSGGLLNTISSSIQNTGVTLSGQVLGNSTWQWSVMDTSNSPPRYGSALLAPHMNGSMCGALMNGKETDVSVHSTMLFGLLGNMTDESNSAFDKSQVQYMTPTCNIDSYATSFVLPCQRCPAGLQTESLGANTSANCDTCEPDYCYNYGSCSVSTTRQEPVCACFFFYDGDTTQCTKFPMTAVQWTIVILADFVIWCFGWRAHNRRAMSREAFQDYLLKSVTMAITLVLLQFMSSILLIFTIYLPSSLWLFEHVSLISSNIFLYVFCCFILDTFLVIYYCLGGRALITQYKSGKLRDSFHMLRHRFSMWNFKPQRFLGSFWSQHQVLAPSVSYEVVQYQGLTSIEHGQQSFFNPNTVYGDQVGLPVHQQRDTDSISSDDRTSWREYGHNLLAGIMGWDQEHLIQQ